MTDKERNVLQEMKHSRRRDTILNEFNRSTLDDVGPLRGDQAIAVLKEMSDAIPETVSIYGNQQSDNGHRVTMITHASTIDTYLEHGRLVEARGVLSASNPFADQSLFRPEYRMLRGRRGFHS